MLGHNLPGHLGGQVVGQGTAPYFIYPNQMNVAYLAAYYSAVNNGNGNASYPYPNQFPAGVPPQGFYPGPLPLMPNHQPIVYPNNLAPQTKSITSPVPQSPSQPQQDTTNKHTTNETNGLSPASSSTSPLLPNPSIEVKGFISTKTNNQSSQSTESSNSTTPTPSAQSSQANLNETNPQGVTQPQPPLGMALMHINPEYFQPPPYGPVPNIYVPQGQYPYPYLPPPPIEYLHNVKGHDGMMVPPMPMNLPPQLLNNLPPKQLNQSGILSPPSGHANQNNQQYEIVDQTNQKPSKQNRYHQQQYRNNYHHRHNNNYQHSHNNNNNNNNNSNFNPNNQYFQNQPHYVQNPHQQNQQAKHHEGSKFYQHRMPYNGPMSMEQNHVHGNLPGVVSSNNPIIADALHVAYTDYRGDFNLDEAAYHTANQWNIMKQMKDSAQQPSQQNRNY